MSGVPVSERHGFAGGKRSSEYQAWADMKARCDNPNHNKFADYGARGITVCARWYSFKAFIADMGMRPAKGFSIERLNNEGNYSKENCAWVTRHAQHRNTRQTIKIEIDGVSKCLKDWCVEYGMIYSTVKQRIYRHKWDYIRALTTPIDPHWRLKNLGVE